MSTEKKPDPAKYPKWKYHAPEPPKEPTEEPIGKIVNDEKEEGELGAGWVDHPDELPKSAKKHEPEHHTPAAAEAPKKR